MLADIVHRLATGGEVLEHELAAAGVPPERLEAAAGEVRAAAASWAALPPGSVWTVHWQPARRSRGRAG
jgi:hypothetical protein